MSKQSPRVAIVYPGDAVTRKAATADNNRFTAIFRALAALGVSAEPAVYHDDLVDEVRQQLSGVDGVLVWVNPIEGGRDRSVLDAMLREIAARGIFVSTDPDIILKMGTKQVLYDTRNIGWGCDTHVYRSVDELRNELPKRLTKGEVRVLKQYRGNGGDGVWEVSRPEVGLIDLNSSITVRHAKRGSVEMRMSFSEFLTLCQMYFSGSGRMIDQAYQERLPDGMVRCYFVGDKVCGFGHQQINALYPPARGESAAKAPQPGPRFYYPPTKPEFQFLKQLAEEQWVPEMQRVLDIRTAQLPVIWDADFLFGKPDASSQDTYVLCEINVSSVVPFPDSAVQAIAELIKERITHR